MYSPGGRTYNMTEPHWMTVSLLLFATLVYWRWDTVVPCLLIEVIPPRPIDTDHGGYFIYTLFSVYTLSKSERDLWFPICDYIMMKTKLDPDFMKTNPHPPGNMNSVKHTWRLNKQRALIEELARMTYYYKGCYHGVGRILISHGIWKINESQWYTQQEKAIIVNHLKSILLRNNCDDELLRLLKSTMDSIIAEVVTESYPSQISPRDLMKLITKVTQLQQQAVQQQIEKIERLQQVMEEEGAPMILRGSKREAEDEKFGKIHFLLTLFLAWFLLCYCSDGTVWCVDVDLTFGLPLALSEIVLLLGGDIEKNPGPLSSTYNNRAP